MTLKLVPLRLLCSKVATWNPQATAPEDNFNYIDIASVDRDRKQITATVQYAGKNAPSRARQIVQADDVLVSTVRPNLNAVAIVPPAFDGATASTGFAVLRPDPKKLDARYLFQWLKHPLFVAEMTSSATGASYPAVTDGIVKNSCIPFRSLADQKCIATLLDEADALRRKRREAIKKLDALLRSGFLEMFGDPVANPKGWAVANLSEIGSLDRGKSQHRPRNAPELYGGAYPFIQTGDVANAENYIDSYRQTYSELGLKQSKMWEQGTLCITIAANIAMTGILKFDACFPDSVVGFLPNQRAKTEYVYSWFGFMQKHLERIAPESAQKNINLEILRALPIQEPPIELQQTFVVFFQELIGLRTKMIEAEQQENQLFLNIQQQVFHTEPTGYIATQSSTTSPCLTLDF